MNNDILSRGHGHSSQSSEGVLTTQRDVLKHFGVHIFLGLFREVALFVPPLFLSVHLREQKRLNGA